MRAKSPGQSAFLMLDVVRVLNRQHIPYSLLMGCVMAGVLLTSCGRPRIFDQVEEGNVQAVANLLEAGADIDARGREGMTPLMVAATEGHLEIARLLLDRGAEVDQTSRYGYTALVLAAYYGQGDSVRLLLERGAQVNVVTGPVPGQFDFGTTGGMEPLTPLTAAVRQGHGRIVRLLLEHGADVNIQKGEALVRAALDGDIVMLDLLHENGARINAPGQMMEPVVAAASGGHSEAVRWFAERGADINSQIHGTTALLQASGSLELSGGEEDYRAIVQYLVEQGADVNAMDMSGFTPIMYVMPDRPLALYLTEHGADARLGKINPDGTVFNAYSLCERRIRNIKEQIEEEQRVGRPVSDFHIKRLEAHEKFNLLLTQLKFQPW